MQQRARSIFCQELFSQRCCVTYTARCIEVILTVGGRQQSISGDTHGRMDEQTEGGGHRLRQTLGNERNVDLSPRAPFRLAMRLAHCAICTEVSCAIGGRKNTIGSSCECTSSSWRRPASCVKCMATQGRFLATSSFHNSKASHALFKSQGSEVPSGRPRTNDFRGSSCEWATVLFGWW